MEAGDPPRPEGAHGVRNVDLQDGAQIVLRPVRPDDKSRFLAAFERLSPESRYRRFLSPHPRLSPVELRYFTEVDHYDHEAIVAIDRATEEGIGVARYIRLRDAPDTAEVAVTVVDDWQGRGVGTALLHELLGCARKAGIRHAAASVLATNVPVLELLRDVGSPHVVRNELGIEDVTVEIPERGLGHLADALRRAAAGMPADLTPRASAGRSRATPTPASSSRSAASR
jgi:GNAT superfamily N-acetyltransferase